MSAQVIRLRCGVAARYAKFASLSVRSEDYEEALEDNLKFAVKLVSGGFGHADMDQMIAIRRERILRELQELKHI